jgi:hypothetical protein
MFETSRTLTAALAMNLGSDRDVMLGHLDCSYLPAVLATLDTICTPEAIQRMPQKGIIKTVRHAKWIASDGLALNKRGGFILDPAIGMLSCIVGLTSQARIGFHDAHAVMGGTMEGSTQVGGVSRAKLHKLLPSIIRRNAGTLSAQSSRTVGAGKKEGIFSALGITSKVDGHGFTVLNRNHPLILATCDTLNRMSETTIVEMMDAAE